jgi:hypothetical protein
LPNNNIDDDDDNNNSNNKVKDDTFCAGIFMFATAVITYLAVVVIL